MGLTDNFKKQHKELLQTAKEISDVLDAEKLSRNAGNARSLLSKLAGKLTVHLLMEDRSLYPNLLKHSDPNVQSLAKRYIDEMGDVKTTFEKYSKNWVTSSKIQDNPDGFVRETKGILDALAKRIEKEDNELYPAVDRI